MFQEQCTHIPPRDAVSPCPSAPHSISPGCCPSSRVNSLRRKVRSDYRDSLCRNWNIGPFRSATASSKRQSLCFTAPSAELVSTALGNSYRFILHFRHNKPSVPGQAHQTLNIPAAKSFPVHSKLPPDAVVSVRKTHHAMFFVC